MTQTVEEQRNIAAFRTIVQRIINDGELDLCAQYMADSMAIRRYGLASTFALLNGGRQAPPDGGAIAGFKAGLSMLRAAFPDWTHEILTVVAKDDQVSGTWRLRCHHTEPFFGRPPTGNEIAVDEVGTMRFVDGKMTEGWFMIDELAFAQQLGVLPAAVPATPVDAGRPALSSGL